jgi:hypothetical protein
MMTHIVLNGFNYNDYGYELSWEARAMWITKNNNLLQGTSISLQLRTHLEQNLYGIAWKVVKEEEESQPQFICHLKSQSAN